MAGKAKINLKDKLDENELDLSLMELTLTDVPVKDIVALPRVNSLLLSNNRLVTLPANFATLTNLIKLDLSKNILKELPENFGMLTKLQSLDLYSNKLERLPLSFADLKNLRWLDLKDNPLVPSLAAEAGDCLDMKGCQLAAKRVVQLMTVARTEYEKRRQKEIQEVGARKVAQKSEEEKQQEKQRQEKKAAKQQRKAQTKNQANQKSSPPEKEEAKIEAPKKPVTEIHAPTNPSRDRGPSIWKRLAYWFFVLLLISTLSFLSFAFWSHKGAFDLPNIQKSLAKTGKIVQEKLASLDRKFLGKLVIWTIDYSNLARQKFIEGLTFALALLEEIGSVCAVVLGRYLEILKREGPSSFRFVIDALYAFGETCHNLWVVVVDNIRRTIAD